jgi:hypothetical protein
MQLSRPMRGLLLACGPMNVVGAISFAPPFPDGRRMIGLAEPPAFYLWVLSAWILAFGAAFAVHGWTGRANRTVLALAAWGKGVFGALLLGGVAAGDFPALAIAGGGPDLVLAAVFAGWLWRTRETTPPR